MSDDKPDVQSAYALNGSDDALRLYRDWAATYDDDFVDAQDYRLPELVALAYAGRGGTGPVLDVGAGTGAVGLHLSRLGVAPLEATDISAEMLDVARQKSVYAELFTGDITRQLFCEPGYYSGVVSAGTFTLGHVGPEALDEVLRLTSHGGLVVISVYNPHFDGAGFAVKLADLGAAIRDLRIDEVAVYGDRATPEHRDHRARIVSFHKA